MQGPEILLTLTRCNQVLHELVKLSAICITTLTRPYMFGKGMGGGVAVSGVVGRDWIILDLPDVGNMSVHICKFIACAAGKAVLEEIKSRDLIQASAIKGELLHKLLNLITSYPQG